MREYDPYVPLHSNDGAPIPSAKLNQLKKRLIERFGGLTQFPQANDGFWKIGPVTFRDKIVILRVLSNERTAAADRFWRHELGEILELRPLVIDDADWLIHFD